MRYLTIVIFLFCFQVSLAMVNEGKQYEYNAPTATEWMGEVETEEIKDANFFQNLVTDFAEALAIFSGFVKGVWYFIKVVGGGVIWFPKTLIDLGLSSTFAYLFSLPVYFMYFIGVAQFLAGRQTEGMR